MDGGRRGLRCSTGDFQLATAYGGDIAARTELVQRIT